MKIKKLRFNNIRSKLIISLIGICVIPLSILGYGSNIQSKSILNEKLKVTSQQTLSEVNDGIDNYFNGFSSMVIMLSNNYNFINGDKSEPASYIPALLQNIQESDDNIFSSYFGTANGDFEIYPNNKMPDGFDPRERPWYKEALDNRGQVIITLPFKDAQTGKSVVSVARTVERWSGNRSLRNERFFGYTNRKNSFKESRNNRICIYFGFRRQNYDSTP